MYVQYEWWKNVCATHIAYSSSKLFQKCKCLRGKLSSLPLPRRRLLLLGVASAVRLLFFWFPMNSGLFAFSTGLAFLNHIRKVNENIRQSCCVLTWKQKFQANTNLHRPRASGLNALLFVTSLTSACLQQQGKSAFHIKNKGTTTFRQDWYIIICTLLLKTASFISNSTATAS